MNRPYVPLPAQVIEDIAAVYFNIHGDAWIDCETLMRLVSEVVDIRGETESQQKQIQSLAQANLKLRAENDGFRQALSALKGGVE